MSVPARAEVAVIGAGVVGLACAAALARAGRAPLILERDEAIARGVTSRSSEVVHAGLYYPPGSLKATLCMRGRDLLYARCAARHIPHRRLGKLVVATCREQVAALEALSATARANGVDDLTWLEPAEVRRLEPALRCETALSSPSSGIVDAHALCLDLLAEAESHGAVLVRRARVDGIQRAGGGLRLSLCDADGRAAILDCVAAVNAAGLAADRVAASAGIDVEARGWRLHPCKGDYFALRPGAPLALGRLVYPLPDPDGALGVHATLDLAGRMRFGPDAEYVAEPDYRVDAAKAERFAAAAGRYLPALQASWLTPDQAGVRPRLAAPGDPPRDFVVAEASDDGVPGLVNLVGIESPGLTAALALGEHVTALLASL